MKGWVVCRKMNCQKEYTTLIWAVIRSHNCGLQMKHVISNWTCRTLCWRVTGQITKFLINPFQRHSLCFSPDSLLSRCVLKGPAKLLIIPMVRKDCLFLSHWLRRAQGTATSCLLRQNYCQLPSSLPATFQLAIASIASSWRADG